MALECKKPLVCDAGGVIVSTLSTGPLQSMLKTPRQSNNDQLPLGATMSHEGSVGPSKKVAPAEVDVREVYFLIMHFLSDGPCRKTCAQLRNELSEYKLLPRRYHAWYSRAGACSGDDEDDGLSVPLSYSQLLERYSFIEKNHLVKLLEQLYNRNPAWGLNCDAKYPTAADASTLLGTGSVSLLNTDQCGIKKYRGHWNHVDQIKGLTLREIGGGLTRHHRAPSIRAVSYAIVKPSVLVNRVQIIKTFRGHRNAVYCAIFDKSGEYVITGSDDRLVKIWSTTTGFCLRSCRGHEGDITDLAVNANNTLVASASNDCFIRVWRFPDGLPISVLKGHTCAVTAIAFSPRQGCEHHLLSTSDDGTCRIWDARDSSVNARIYAPKSEAQETGSKAAAATGPTNTQSGFQILCCAFNASGTIFVTGSADKLARVWDACKWTDELHGGPNHELDTLKGHEDDVNYVQFSGCAAPSRPVNMDAPAKDERLSKFRNSWFAHESIVTCSRDGSAIIWAPRPRKYHGKGRWTKAYHLRVPPPPMPPQPPRGVPRQRLLPTPRGVNMIVWSLDNCYVLAAIMDCRICVWNAVDGSLVHSLTGHTKSTFVLDVHPYDPRIAMSAGYDGRVIIWDIWEGRTIHVYETGEFNLVDGKFSTDGTSIIISDEVGQIYLLATGEGESQKDAKYDQFFLGDYRPLIRDVHGNVLDQETQLPPHQRNLQDLLCDANMIPYAEPYQSMYQQRRLGALGTNWQPPSIQWVVGTMDDGNYLANGLPGIPLVPDEDDSLLVAHQGRTRWVEQPIDEDAMDWEQETVDDTGSDYTLSYENGSEDDEREGSLTSTEEFLDSLEDEDSSDDEEQGQTARLRRSERNKRKAEGVVITSSGRLVKRKHKDNGGESSLRRSKRHKNAKSSRKGSYARGSSDLEQSRRPKRLAARNACLIFSQISAEEKSHSDSSENANITGEEQISPLQSVEKECDSLEKPDEASAAEAEPSEVADCSRRRRSHLSFKLRVPSKGFAKEGEQSPDDKLFPDQVREKNALSSEGIPELKLCTSDPKYINSEKSNSENEIINGIGLGNLSETRNNAKSLEDLHETSQSEGRNRVIDSPSSHGEKRAWESRSSKAIKRARVEESDEALNAELPISRSDDSESLNGKIGAPAVSEDRVMPPAHSDRVNQVEPIEGLAVTSENLQCDIPDSDVRSRSSRKIFRSRDGDSLQAKSIPEKEWEDVLDSYDVGERKVASWRGEVGDVTCCLEQMIERSRSNENDHRGQETASEEHTPDQSCYSPKRFDPCPSGQNDLERNFGEQEASSPLQPAAGTLSDNNSVERLEGDDIRIDKHDNLEYFSQATSMHEEEQLEDEVPNHDTGLYEDAESFEGETNILGSRMTSAKERETSSQEEETAVQEANAFEDGIEGVKEETFCHDIIEGSPFSKMGTKPLDSCIGLMGETSKISAGLPARRHHSMGTSWQHNSDVCLWLRQGIPETTDGEPSASEEEISSGTAEATGSIGQGYGVDETFHGRRGKGKSKIMKHVKSSGLHYRSPVYRQQKKRRSETSSGKVEAVVGPSGVDLCTKKPRFSVRTRRTQEEENYEISEQNNRTEERNGTSLKELRVSRRPRNNFGWKELSSHSEAGKASEDIAAWKGKKRSKKKVSWLMFTKVEEGTRYIPQLGDEVAYVMQGQDEFEGSARFEDKGPSKTLRARLSAVEMCCVVGLDYGFLPGFDSVSCKLTLKLIGEECRACGKTFGLSLPELTDFPDFVIERSRYEAGIRRKWTKRDKCKVWWREDTVDEKGDEKGGVWYYGRVISVEAKSSEHPDSPWERCSVKYVGDSTGPHKHSPWELFDIDSTDIVCSRLDDCEKLRVLSSIEEVEESCKDNQDEYGLRGLRKLIQKPDFLAKTPVPLSLDTIKARLNNNYYRNLDALRHDIRLLATNVENFLFDNILTLKIQRLVTRLLEDV